MRPRVEFCLLLTICLCAPATARADVVTDWNLTTSQVVAAAVPARPGPSAILDFAVVQAAVYDALRTFDPRFEPYVIHIEGASGSPIAAAARAARDVLVNRFPAQTASIDAIYANYLASNGLLATDAGVLVGQQAAAACINRRLNDGSFPANPEIFTGGTAPGQWRPTQPAFAPMAAPWLGAVVPFTLKDSAQFLARPAPPHLTSGTYTHDYNEVKALGARVNSARTAEQTDLAHFYSENFVAQLNRTLRAIALVHIDTLVDSARLFALANMAGADALITSWNTKKHYNFWRPSTAIVEGDNDGNPRTEGDGTWLPLINDPAYPDYTSGANNITSAFMRTLHLFFGSDDFTFDVTSNAALAIRKMRTYHRYSDVSKEVVEARIYLGIHFRFADTVARHQGKLVADWAFSHFLRPVE